MPDPTEADICREALQVQDAPNLRGILHSFHINACALARQIPDADKAYRHPAMFLFAAHVLFLTGGGSVDTNKYSEATAFCQAKVKAEENKSNG